MKRSHTNLRQIERKMRVRQIHASSNGMQFFDAQLAVLALATACSHLGSQFLEVFFGHPRLCEDFGAKIVDVAGIIGDKQAVRFLVSHLTSPFKRNSKSKSPSIAYPNWSRLAIRDSMMLSGSPLPRPLNYEIAYKNKLSRRKGKCSHRLIAPPWRGPKMRVHEVQCQRIAMGPPLPNQRVERTPNSRHPRCPKATQIS